MNTQSAAGVVLAIAAAAFVLGCRNQTPSASTTPTVESADPCPGATRSDELADVSGLYSEECLRALVPWAFPLPELSEHYNAYSYTVETLANPSTVTVVYLPQSGAVPVRRVSVTISLGYALTLPHEERTVVIDGTQVRVVFADDGEREAYWQTGRQWYEIHARNGPDGASIDELLLSTASAYIQLLQQSETNG